MERLNLWIQIFTSIAVLTGIGVVVWELQQTRSLFKTQMGMETTQSYSEHLLSLFGEDVAETLERACFAPDDLKRSDLVILDAYFTSLMSFPFRYITLEKLGGFSSGWETVAKVQVRKILSFPSGRNWLSDWQSVDPQINDVVRSELGNPDNSSCAVKLEKLMPDDGSEA